MHTNAQAILAQFQIESDNRAEMMQIINFNKCKIVVYPSRPINIQNNIKMALVEDIPWKQFIFEK